VSVRTTGRNTMGVRVMNLRGADKVSSMARVVTSSDANGDGRGATNGHIGSEEYPPDDDLDLQESDGLEEDGMEEDGFDEEEPEEPGDLEPDDDL